MALHAGAEHYYGPECSAKFAFYDGGGNITNAVEKPAGRVNEWSISLYVWKLPKYVIWSASK